MFWLYKTFARYMYNGESDTPQQTVQHDEFPERFLDARCAAISVIANSKKKERTERGSGKGTVQCSSDD